MDLDTWRHTARSGILAMKCAPHERLWFATIIFAVLVVRLDEDRSEEVKAIIADNKSKWDATLQASGSIARDPGTRWAGPVEIDLLNPRHYCGGAKRCLMADLGVDIDTLTPEHRVMIVHAHIIVDRRGHTRRTLDRAIRTQWPGPRRVVLADISDEGTVASNLSNIADYATKFRLQYSDAWDGKRTRYGSRYESAWRRYMTDLYNKVGWENFLFMHVRVQSAATPKRKNSIAKQPVNATEDRHELTIEETITQEPLEEIVNSNGIIAQEPLVIVTNNPESLLSPQDVLEKLRAHLGLRDLGPVHELEGHNCENCMGEEESLAASSIKAPDPYAARRAEHEAKYPVVWPITEQQHAAIYASISEVVEWSLETSIDFDLTCTFVRSAAAPPDEDYGETHHRLHCRSDSDAMHIKLRWLD